MTTLSEKAPTAFINELFEFHYLRCYPYGPAQQVPGEGGVPPAMQDGQIDPEGWVKWRMLPSTVNPSDIEGLERRLSVSLPTLLRAYLLGHHQLFGQLGSFEHMFLIPETPVDRPFEPFSQELAAWLPLPSAGLLPFGEFGDGWGPACLDLLSPTNTGDHPVVWLEHELLANLSQEALANRGVLQPLIQPLYPSFRDFLVALFRDFPYSQADGDA